MKEEYIQYCQVMFFLHQLMAIEICLLKPYLENQSLFISPLYRLLIAKTILRFKQLQRSVFGLMHRKLFQNKMGVESNSTYHSIQKLCYNNLIISIIHYQRPNFWISQVLWSEHLLGLKMTPIISLKSYMQSIAKAADQNIISLSGISNPSTMF